MVSHFMPVALRIYVWGVVWYVVWATVPGTRYRYIQYTSRAQKPSLVLSLLALG